MSEAQVLPGSSRAPRPHAYASSLRLRRRVGQDGFAIDALAGLLRVNLAAGRYWFAQRLVWGIGQHLALHGAEGVENPFRVATSCVKALETLGHPEEARRLLQASLDLLQERAALLTSADDRESWLHGVPVNRALLELARSLEVHAD